MNERRRRKDASERAFGAAERRGAAAFLEGTPITACPYRDQLGTQGVTWSRAWRNAWRDGWMRAERESREGRR